MIETERLYIEKFTENDGLFFLELINSPNWIQFIGDRGISTQAEVLMYIEKSVFASYREKGYGPYKMILKDGLIPIGVSGFYKRDYLKHVDIGFAILPQYEGKGFAFEASSAILDYGAKTLSLDPVLAITTKANIRSQNLLERIGLKKIDLITPKDSNEELLLFSN